MKPDAGVLPPEIEAIVRELARDPRSRLLRVPRERAIRDPFGTIEPVGSNAPGLLSAERELLRVHRADLARLLREECVLRLTGNLEFLPWFNKSLSLTKNLQVPERSALREEQACELAITESSRAELGGRELLVQVVGTAGEAITVGQLAGASLRLEARDSARVYAGWELFLGRHDALTIQAMDDVLRASPSPRIATFAWDLVAMARYRSEAGEAAIEACRRAFALGDLRATPLLNWFFFAVGIGSRSAALEASERLDVEVPADHPSVADFARGMLALRAKREWQPTDAMRTLLASIGGRTGLTTQRISHVFE